MIQYHFTSIVDYEADVLVIGGGGAGTSAALMASEKSSSLFENNSKKNLHESASYPWLSIC